MSWGITANLRFQRTLELPVSPARCGTTRALPRVLSGALATQHIGVRICSAQRIVPHHDGQWSDHRPWLGYRRGRRPNYRRAEASSKTIRDKTWNWPVDVFLSRFADYAGSLMIMTRWHVDDPVGRWCERFPETRIRRYPAIADASDWSVRQGYRKTGGRCSRSKAA